MIGIFLGEQNSGKSLSMSYYAYRYFNKGYEVFSNLKLNFRYTPLSKDLIVNYTMSQKQFNKAVFIIDEIYLFLDSRNFSKGLNKIMTYFLLQTSKRDVHLFGTAQYLNTVEKRFRENINFQCYCMRVLKENDDYNELDTNLRMIKDNNKLYIRQNFMMKRIKDNFIPVWEMKTFYLKAEPVFKMFDTRELLAID